MDNKIAVREEMSLDGLVAHLQGLIDGFKAGKVLVENGSDFIVLIPCNPVDVKFEIKINDEKAKCSMELSWPLHEVKKSEQALRISDGRYVFSPGKD